MHGKKGVRHLWRASQHGWATSDPFEPTLALKQNVTKPCILPELLISPAGWKAARRAKSILFPFRLKKEAERFPRYIYSVFPSFPSIFDPPANLTPIDAPYQTSFSYFWGVNIGGRFLIIIRVTYPACAIVNVFQYCTDKPSLKIRHLIVMGKARVASKGFNTSLLFLKEQQRPNKITMQWWSATFEANCFLDLQLIT